MDIFPVALVNIKNSAEQFETNLRYSCPWILDLAHAHGWEPARTLEPSKWRTIDYNDQHTSQYADYASWELPGAYDRSGTFRPDPTRTWSGTYFTDQRQVVTTEDARSLANALERAIATPIKHMIEIPVSRTFGHVWSTSVNELLTMETEGLDSLYEDVPGLIAFCRTGTFYIR